jgi:hypothetical protein
LSPDPALQQPVPASHLPVHREELLLRSYHCALWKSRRSASFQDPALLLA